MEATGLESRGETSSVSSVTGTVSRWRATALLAVSLPVLAAGQGVASDAAPRKSVDSLGAVRRHHTKKNSEVFGVIGFASFGVIWVLPENISKWSPEQKKFSHLLDAYRTPPVWDKDPFFWNWVVHPVAGSYAYLAERNWGERPLRGFLFSTATSVAWEYGFEAWIEHPSAQDLLITSTTGSVLGELSYRATRRMARGGFNPLERVMLTVINPAWVLQKGFRP